MCIIHLSAITLWQLRGKGSKTGNFFTLQRSAWKTCILAFTRMLLRHLPVISPYGAIAFPHCITLSQAEQEWVLSRGAERTWQRAYGVHPRPKLQSNGIRWYLLEASPIHRKPTRQPTGPKGYISNVLNPDTPGHPQMYFVCILSSWRSFGCIRRTKTILDSWLNGVCCGLPSNFGLTCLTESFPRLEFHRSC